MKKFAGLLLAVLVAGGGWFGWQHYDATHVSAREAAAEICALVAAEPEFGAKLDTVAANLTRVNRVNSWIAAAKPATDGIRNFKETRIVGVHVWTKACQLQPELLLLDAALGTFGRVVDQAAELDAAASAFQAHHEAFKTHYAALADSPTWEDVDTVIAAAEGMRPVVGTVRERVDQLAALTTRSREQLTAVGRVLNDPAIDDLPGSETFAPPLRGALAACLSLVIRCDAEVGAVAGGFGVDDAVLARIAGVIGDRTRTR